MRKFNQNLRGIKQIFYRGVAILLATVIVGLSSFMASEPVYAQAVASTEEKTSSLTGTRKQLATIIFSGLAGAILGLSTLSFYGRPQDHLSNIAVGFAVGVIAGTIYTTYQAATKPYDNYDLSQNSIWSDELYKRELAKSNSTALPQLNYSWSF